MVDGGGTGSGVLVDITTSVTLNQTNTDDTFGWSLSDY